MGSRGENHNWYIQGVVDSDSGYEYLSKAVVVQACRDMLKGLKYEWLKCYNRADYDYVIYHGEEAQKFLKDKNRLLIYTDIDGNEIIKLVYIRFGKWMINKYSKGVKDYEAKEE